MKKNKIDWLVCFSSCAGDGECHRRRGMDEGKKAIHLPAAGFFLWRRVNPRAASGDGRGIHAPPLFLRPENLLNTVPAAEGYPCNF